MLVKPLTTLFNSLSALTYLVQKMSMSNQILNADAPPKVTHSTRHVV